MSETEIKKLIIKLGGRETSVSITEARRLHACLDELFGKQANTQVIEKHIHHDYWHPYWYWPSNTITVTTPLYCGGSSSAGTLSLDNTTCCIDVNTVTLEETT